MSARQKAPCLGLLGGTFDPVHMGHLAAATQALSHYALDQVLFIPNNQPSHRRQPMASAAHRQRMLELALAPSPQLHVSSLEIDRGGISYTRDTLEALRADYPQSPLVFILGADAFAGLNTWGDYHALFAYSHLLVLGREQTAINQAPWQQALWAERGTQDKTELVSTLAGRLYHDPHFDCTASATALRAELAHQRSTRPQMLLPAVFDYITAHSLYLPVT